MRRDGPIPAKALGPGPAGCRAARRRSGGSSRRTSESTACARSGGSSAARASSVARCTVARLMRQMGSARRRPRQGGPGRRSATRLRPARLDRVNRQFQAPRPNLLWVSDFTYVATWQGFVYVAFVIDAFARRIVGWRVSRTAHAGFVLDALEQALHDRRPVQGGGLVHHSDRGVQYVSIHYTERLAEAGIEPSVGSVGDSYDNALAETINRPLQDRGDPPARALALAGSRRVRHPGMGRLVQQPPPARTDRQYAAGRSRGSATMPNCRRPPWRPDSTQMASGKPGAVQVEARRLSCAAATSVRPAELQSHPKPSLFPSFRCTSFADKVR